MSKIIFYNFLYTFLIFQSFSLSQWIQLNSTTPKNLHTLKFINQDTGFVAGQQGTFLKTTDGGDSWTDQNYYETPLIDPANLQTWYMANRPGVWKSTDEGTNWFEVNEGLSEVAVCRIAASPGNLDRYWVMTRNGVGFTRDGGDTWKFPLRIPEWRDLEEIDVYILSPNGGQVIFHPTNQDQVYLTQNTLSFRHQLYCLLIQLLRRLYILFWQFVVPHQ